jgi:hypothetical protein
VRIGRTENGEREGVCGSRMEKEKWVGKKEREIMGMCWMTIKAKKGKRECGGGRGGGGYVGKKMKRDMCDNMIGKRERRRVCVAVG